MLSIGVFHAGGAAALVALRMVLAAATADALVWALRPITARRSGRLPTGLAALGALPLILAWGLRPISRPELVSLLLLVLVFGAFAVRAPATRGGVRAHLLLLAAGVLTGFANPYGLNGFLLPFTLWSQVGDSPAVFSTIGELRRTWAVVDEVSILHGVFTLAWLAGLWRLRRDSKGLVLLLFGGALVLLGFLTRRNVTFTALAGALGLAAALGGIRRPTARIALASAALLLFAVLAGDSSTGRRLQPWSCHGENGFRFDQWMMPVGPEAYLAEFGYEQPRFVDVNSGAYDAWVRGPGVRSLLDARLEVLGAKGLRAHFDALGGGDAFEETCRRHNLEAAVVDRRAPHHQDLIQHLAATEDWVPFYADRAFLVFLRRDETNRPWLTEHPLPARMARLMPGRLAERARRAASAR